MITTGAHISAPAGLRSNEGRRIWPVLDRGKNTARKIEHMELVPDTRGVPATMLTAEDLSVVYNSSRGPQKAVDRLSLSIGDGEFVSIIGPSGCGKSTFLNVAAGLLQPSSGRAALSGQTINGPRPDIGVVFQRPTLLPWATVEQNVLIPIRALRRPLQDYRERARELLGMVGLGGHAGHYPEELSGGMQQRVGIVRALIHDPSLLLMDEPFAALDAMTRERMSLELQEIWNASRKTVLFITHSIPEAVFLSDRVLIMSASPGRIREEVTIDLPRPRDAELMATSRFAEICGEMRRMFNQSSETVQ